jgi:MFS transporter, CP family, cyanate transporter
VADQQHVLISATARQRTPRGLIVVAMVLTGLSMRTAVTSVGPVLTDLERVLHMGSGVAGLLTTLPVLCFAVIGTTASRLIHRFGEHLLLIVAMAAMTLGLVARALAGSVAAFLGFTVLALVGGAVSNVIMPSLVKRHFPDRIGPMTALYTTALSVGMTAAAALTVPIGNVAGATDRWRLGLGCWAVLSAVAVLPWLPTLSGDRPNADVAARLPLSRLLHSRTAWALTLLFAAQSFQAHISFGWFETFLRDHGSSATDAGLLVALYSALSIPVSLAMPMLAARGERRLILILCGCYLAAYIGLALAPLGVAWVWMVLAGLGSGLFPLCLTMFGLHTRTATTTAALSAFAQGVGYLIAATGPLLVGLSLGSPHNWAGFFVVLFAALAACIVFGVRASEPRFVDDEVDATTSVGGGR